MAFERRELEFIGKEGIFGAELLKIGIVGEGIGIEHPGLPEEKCLYLQQRVAVFLHKM